MNRMKKRWLLFVFGALFIMTGIRSVMILSSEKEAVPPSAKFRAEQPKKPAAIRPAEPSTKTPAPDATKEAPIQATAKKTERIISHTVPFTAQAPFGEWTDPHQQEGCEESTSLMAVLWARGETEITKEAAKKEILAISAFEADKYDNYHDTSASNTLKIIINEYFNYAKAEFRENSNLGEIKNELALGNVLILPMDGKKLKNPNFSHGGPERHMIVIKGYDAHTGEFITNDPGTRRGESYRYAEVTIDSAWRDYLSGTHVPIKKIEKNLIIIHPQQAATR